MRSTGGALLFLLGLWSLVVSGYSVLHGAGVRLLLADGAIALGGLACVATAVLFFVRHGAKRGRLWALLAPAGAIVAEALSLVLFQVSLLGGAKILLLLVALLLATRPETKGLPAKT